MGGARNITFARALTEVYVCKKIKLWHKPQIRENQAKAICKLCDPN